MRSVVLGRRHEVCLTERQWKQLLKRLDRTKAYWDTACSCFTIDVPCICDGFQACHKCPLAIGSGLGVSNCNYAIARVVKDNAPALWVWIQHFGMPVRFVPSELHWRKTNHEKAQELLGVLYHVVLSMKRIRRKKDGETK